jgi:hypothetical protein
MTTTFAPMLTTERTRTQRPLWQIGLATGAVAAAANVLVSAAARGFGVSLVLIGSGAHPAPIPVGGFATMTLLGAVVGVVLAAGARRFANNPATRFVRIAALGTVVSLVPGVALAQDARTLLVLWLTHLLAAVIIVPRLAAQLRDGSVEG